MSGSRTDPAASGLAEQHLGDRLSALVDGELGHDARERVLAHVATCPKCKAEVDAQRRLKNVFAEAAPPPPSESFLARLQGLPGGGAGGDGPPLGGRGFPGGLPGLPGRSGASGTFGLEREDRFGFGVLPAGPGPVGPEAGGGFRIHPVGRTEGERSASRGLRFAFVAAGAVSLAAVALGGVTAGTPGDAAAEARGGSGTGSNVTPAGTAGSAATAPEVARRRQSPGPPSALGRRAPGSAPAAPTALSAPLLPGAPLPADGQAPEQLRTLTTPVLAGAAVMSPLIRPLNTTPPISLTSWSTGAAPGTPGLVTGSVPGTTPGLAPAAPARTAH